MAEQVRHLGAGTEMVSYVVLIGVGLRWCGLKDNRPAIMVAILRATVLILAMALVACNVGTPDLIRYGDREFLDGLGVLGLGGGRARLGS